MTDDDRQGISAQNSAMAQQALRVLGSAYRHLRNGHASDREQFQGTATG